MSYSPVTSDDGSIRALLRRLDANPRLDADFRTDPLQVLREARMKVAARARATGAGPEGILAGKSGMGSTEIPASSDVTSNTAILLPAEFSAADEAKREASNGALVVINEIDDVAPKAWRGRLAMAGAGFAVCAGLAVTLGSGLLGGQDRPSEIAQAARVDGAAAGPTETADEKSQARLPPAEGVGRFTVAAVSFADVGTPKSTDPAAVKTNVSSAVKPDPVEVATTTRLDVSAGDQVALPIELSPAKGTGEVAAIVLRGLPKDYSVVAAMPSGDGSWVLSPDGLAAARIAVPDAGAGEVSVTAELFDMSAQVVGSPRFVLNVGPANVADKNDPQQARAMLARGHDKLRAGDVVEARSLFKLAAERGIAEGAFALGETFDPAQLAARGAAGQKGDPAQARFWYEYASKRGVAAARERLAALNAGT